jgi:hypothetical protein
VLALLPTKRMRPIRCQDRAKSISKRCRRPLIGHARNVGRRFHLLRFGALTLIGSSVRHAETIRYTKGTGFRSTCEDRLGRRRPCRTCSIRSRRCKAICLPCVATNPGAGSGCVGRRDLGFSSRRVRDPKQLTTWQRHSRESVWDHTHGV